MRERPGPAFERYLAEVDRAHLERPRYRSGPFPWWHPLPVVLMLGGVLALALAVWKVGQASDALRTVAHQQVSSCWDTLIAEPAR